jgi:hypothetical protein
MESIDQDLFGDPVPEPLEYPDAPGHRGVDTSIEAADAIAPVTGRLRKLAYSLIEAAGATGLTNDELADRAEIDRGSIQPRTSELRLLGRIRDSGERRRNENGKRAIVWVLSEFVEPKQTHNV